MSDIVSQCEIIEAMGKAAEWWQADHVCPPPTYSPTPPPTDSDPTEAMVANTSHQTKIRAGCSYRHFRGCGDSA